MLPNGEPIAASVQHLLDLTPEAAEYPTPAVTHALDQLLSQYGSPGLHTLYESLEDHYLVHHLRQQALQVAARCSTVAPEGVVHSEVLAVPLASPLLDERHLYPLSDELRDGMQAMFEPVALDWGTEGVRIRVEPVLLNAVGASGLAPDVFRETAMEGLGVRMASPALRSPLEAIPDHSLHTQASRPFHNGLLLITVTRRVDAILPWEDWVPRDDGRGLEPMYDCSIFGEMARECAHLLVEAGIIRSSMDLLSDALSLGEAISLSLDHLRAIQVEDLVQGLPFYGHQAVVTRHGSANGPVEVRLSVVDQYGRLTSARRFPTAWESADHVVAAVCEVVEQCNVPIADAPGGNDLCPLAVCPECQAPIFYGLEARDHLAPRCPNPRCRE